MCGSMADSQSATAEIRRGKKEQTTGKNIISASALADTCHTIRNSKADTGEVYVSGTPPSVI